MMRFFAGTALAQSPGKMGDSWDSAANAAFSCNQDCGIQEKSKKENVPLGTYDAGSGEARDIESTEMSRWKSPVPEIVQEPADNWT